MNGIGRDDGCCEDGGYTLDASILYNITKTKVYVWLLFISSFLDGSDFIL